MNVYVKYSPERATVYSKHKDWLLHKAKNIDTNKGLKRVKALDKIMRGFMTRYGWRGASSNNVYWNGTKVPIKLIVVPRPRDDRLVTLINPKYKELRGQQVIATEYCGSIPNKPFLVARFPIAIVECTLINGNSTIMDYNFLLSTRNSIILQHEIDHLKGVLISHKQEERADNIVAESCLS